MRARGWTAAAVSLSLGLLFAGSSAWSDPAPDGEAWQVTSQMSMVGVPIQMPSQTQRVCSRPNEAPAQGPDPSCRNTSFSRSGNKLSWTVECTGERPMTGHGEIEYESSDAYTGTIRFESPDGVMVLMLSGKRVGTCQAPR
jgi:hypothetical protein